jgi:ArsR family transcriptional regulator
VADTHAELEGYFKGLADASRLRILNLLLYGELCGCDIQSVLEMTQSNVSRHLTYLKHAGLTVDRREGFRVFYRLPNSANGELKPLFEFLRTAFVSDPVLQNDLIRLKQAIQDGACQMQQIMAWPRLRDGRAVSGRVPRRGRSALATVGDTPTPGKTRRESGPHR